MEAEAGGLNPIWISMHSSRYSEVNGRTRLWSWYLASAPRTRLLFHSDPRHVTRSLSLMIGCSGVTGGHQAVSQVAETCYQAIARADTEPGTLERTKL